MRLSTKGVYALEAMFVFALSPPDQRLSVREISARTGLSDRYLEQIFTRLKRAGLIRSIRGKQGGYCLAQSADQISVLDVLQAAEGDLAPVRCLEKDQACHRSAACRTRPVWQAMGEVMVRQTDQLTLAMLATRYHEGRYEEQIDFSI
ncbi:MAG: Rrf2 family transcriptional regulator [Eubacteriales bacterium]|nr:Rrf2 family transcriptional regulator [Eubacteriales bacterium]MDD3866348.1 Rrf2 family transcriptional regulator [Eubacteriales bacterium]MDD4461343.1 Rrf2 family transcriptional regulator [Eubacteriales bacterium]